jgi:hypothetical protein
MVEMESDLGKYGIREMAISAVMAVSLTNVMVGCSVNRKPKEIEISDNPASLLEIMNRGISKAASVWVNNKRKGMSGKCSKRICDTRFKIVIGTTIISKHGSPSGSVLRPPNEVFQLQ